MIVVVVLVVLVGVSCFYICFIRLTDAYIRRTHTIHSDRDPFIGHFMERAWPEVFHSNCSSGPDYRCHYNTEVNC